MEWTCRCGAVAAEIDPRGGTRAVCYCGSCRRFSALTDAGDALDAYGGSDLYQVAPENARITRGADKLAWVRLTAKGPLRWHTTCCNTPFANTLATPSVPFLTVMSHRFSDPDALGPVAIRVFRREATGKVPDDGTGGTLPLLLAFVPRALKSRLTGGWRRNPLFDDHRRPIAGGRMLGD
ncbi:MAG: DUF6151 family protein [Silicimonas sp.]